LTDWP
jgi:hypothetical protein